MDDLIEFDRISYEEIQNNKDKFQSPVIEELKKLSYSSPIKIDIDDSKKTMINMQLFDVDNFSKVNALRKTHMIFASSMSGKTSFVTCLLFSMFKNNPTKNFYVYNISSTESSKIKLMATVKLVEQYKQKNPEVKCDIKIGYSSSFDSLLTFYNKLNGKPLKYVVKKMNENNEEIEVEQEYESIIFIDDFSDELTNAKNDQFFKKFTSCQRHSAITTIINTHMFKKLPDALKNQAASLSIIGSHTNTNLKCMHENNIMICEIFPNILALKHFFQIFIKSYLQKHTVCTFLNTSDQTLYLYKVSKQFLNYIENEEKIASNSK